MILFLQDLPKYPDAIIDTKTTNESWVRMASVLKAMHVKNYYFFLTLLQPSLQGVDPHSTTLTMVQKTAIRLECQYNIWYFFREVARIPNGNSPLQFRLGRPVLAMLWAFCCGIDFALIMPRQIGKSVAIDLLDIWLLNFYYQNTKMFLYTKDAPLRKLTIERIKDTQKLLPPWLNPTNKKDADNNEVITCVARGNQLNTAVGHAVAFNARNVGRGHTYPFVHVDEGPFIANVQISLPVLSGSTTAARENYENSNTLYGNLYTTTAGKLDSKEGKYMYSFIYSGMFWNEQLYDCVDKHEARDMVVTNSSEGRCLIHATFSHRQCGKTDEWLRKVLSLTKRTLDEIARDFFNKWTSGTEASAITTQMLEIINNSEQEPKYLLISVEKYIMRWYIESYEIDARMAVGHYILSLDSSNAVGRDANGLVLTDVRDMGVLAASTISEANLLNYALWIANFLIKYLNVTFIVEHKSSATSIIDTVSAKLTAAGIDPFKRMYNRVVDNHKVRTEDYAEISLPVAYRPEQIYLRFKNTFGFNTTQNSRQFLYDVVLQDAVKSTGHKVFDKTLATELKGLIVKNGRVDHLPGAHDDLVIAWLLAHWFIKHTKNLQHYGINPIDCLSLVSTDGATLTEDEILERSKLAILNTEIINLKAALISSHSLIESLKIEKLLAYTVREANLLGDTTLNLDVIMREVTTNKVNKRSLKSTLNQITSQRMGLGLFNSR